MILCSGGYHENNSNGRDDGNEEERINIGSDECDILIWQRYAVAVSAKKSGERGY